MIFGLGGKICIVKIETWIVFPEPFEPCFTNQKLIYGDESDTVVKNHNSTLFFKGLISISIDVLSASSSYKATYSELAGYITISSIPEAVLVVKQRVSTSIRMKLASMYK